MLSETDAIQPADLLPVSRRYFNRLPNNNCSTNFQGEFYHMTRSSTPAQSTQKRRSPKNPPALQQHGLHVVVSNPMATKAIAQSKIKTDKVDAKVLAQLLCCDFLPTVWQPDADTRLRPRVISV